MYFPDLSPYQYVSQYTAHTLNVGWLDAEHNFLTGKPDEEILERLKIHCQNDVNPTFGIHPCELCGNVSGSAEIRVFGRDDKIYAAPSLIWHYMAEHHYQPPAEFLQAIQEGPLPDTPDYKKFWHWYYAGGESEKEFMTPEEWEAYQAQHRPHLTVLPVAPKSVTLAELPANDLWAKVNATKRRVLAHLGPNLSYEFRSSNIYQAYTGLCGEAQMAYEDGELNEEIVSKLEEYAEKAVELWKITSPPAPLLDEKHV